MKFIKFMGFSEYMRTKRSKGPGLLRGLSEALGSGKFNFLPEVLGFKSLAPQLPVSGATRCRLIGCLAGLSVLTKPGILLPVP